MCSKWTVFDGKLNSVTTLSLTVKEELLTKPSFIDLMDTLWNQKKGLKWLASVRDGLPHIILLG